MDENCHWQEEDNVDDTSELIEEEPHSPIKIKDTFVRV